METTLLKELTALVFGQAGLTAIALLVLTHPRVHRWILGYPEGSDGKNGRAEKIGKATRRRPARRQPRPARSRR